MQTRPRSVSPTSGGREEDAYLQGDTYVHVQARAIKSTNAHRAYEHRHTHSDTHTSGQDQPQLYLH